MNWRELILEEMKQHNESFADVVSSTISDELLDKAYYKYDENGRWINPYDDMFQFTIWTHKRTYVPAMYDPYPKSDCFSWGLWCVSISRNPDGIPTPHIGGG